MLIKIGVIIIIILWILHLLRPFYYTKLLKGPPFISGLFPFLGCAISFGKGPPITFLKNCYDKYGKIFTIHVGGRYMTFIFDKNEYKTFFFSPSEIVDFQKATQPFLCRCFGMEEKSYSQFHEDTLTKVRSALVPLNLVKSDYTTQLNKLIAQNFKKT
eukprot:TRINITY_DN1874_c0_g2_i1.p1 TRINITY_DN1874_c0_g2~~TRINITY_DN1874_c0_g2_i1.p1  ORF type:complete len:158 (-),score=25.95 TRINITY_DN1874_c0_g2_i1:25-498(-)